MQVRKVIWDVFELCPTPAAAVAADAGALQALIQPLGLHRKRAAGIQQLSHEYLFKQVGGCGGWLGCGAGWGLAGVAAGCTAAVLPAPPQHQPRRPTRPHPPALPSSSSHPPLQWRDPAELYGIGKYGSDAYHIFCRGRWAGPGRQGGRAGQGGRVAARLARVPGALHVCPPSTPHAHPLWCCLPLHLCRRWREVQPEDKDLRRYREWLESTGGLGTGLSRHRTMVPAA